jgi:uncharacterized protein involved in outer membrane biogenesis
MKRREGQGIPAFSADARARSFRAVNRLSKVILITLCTVVVLAVLGVAGLWSYVRTDGARSQLEEALGNALKVPVKFESITLEFPSKLRAVSVTTVDTGVAGQPKIAARGLQGTLALRPLLSGDFEVRDLVLESPTFEWPQTAEGKWVWPSKPKTKSTEPRGPKEPASDKPTRKRVAIRGVKVKDGTVTLLDHNQQPVITASGVITHFAEISGKELTGTFSAATLTWTKYTFESVQSTLQYSNDVLVLDHFQAEALGGNVLGRFEMNTRAEGQPFKTRVEVARLDLNAFAIRSGWSEGEVSGRLTGSAEIAGRTDRFSRMEGPGRVSIENGRFKKLELFEAIAYALELNDLANLRPKEATVDFNFRDEKMFVESLVLATDNLRIDANGMARFDGKLALDARLTVTERFALTLPEFARGSFAKQPDGRYGLDFKISGKTDKPKTDLAEKLIGTKVQDKVVDLLGGLFGTKPEKKKKEEKQPAESAVRNP